MKRKEINDIDSLYKKIFLYKSFFYKNTIFEISSNNEELNSIIRALNIKDRRKRIIFIYDYCCNKIDNYNKDKNICGFICNKCYTQYNNKYINGCCRKCIYQTDKGCSTKNLTCKLFYCSEVRKRHKVIEYNDLKILKLLTIRQRIILKHNYFSSREDVLKDLYINSIIIFVIRILYRYITKNIKWKD